MSKQIEQELLSRISGAAPGASDEELPPDMQPTEFALPPGLHAVLARMIMGIREDCDTALMLLGTIAMQSGPGPELPDDEEMESEGGLARPATFGRKAG